MNRDSAIAALENPVLDPASAKFLVDHHGEVTESLIQILHLPLVEEDPRPTPLQMNAIEVLRQIGPAAHPKLHAALAEMRNHQQQQKRRVQQIGMLGGDTSDGIHESQLITAVIGRLQLALSK
ncbi:MAG: hypothetical protein ACKV2Q_04330 [Planctomycetaceae bacterium]